MSSSQYRYTFVLPYQALDGNPLGTVRIATISGDLSEAAFVCLNAYCGGPVPAHIEPSVFMNTFLAKIIARSGLAISGFPDPVSYPNDVDTLRLSIFQNGNLVQSIGKDEGVGLSLRELVANFFLVALGPHIIQGFNLSDEVIGVDQFQDPLSTSI